MSEGNGNALSLDDGDWVPLFRKIRHHWLWESPEELRAWLDLLMLANYHDGHFPFKQGVLPVKVGQIPTTIASLAKRWGWGRTRVRSFLAKLQPDSEIRVSYHTWDPKNRVWTDRRTDSGLMLITVSKYPVPRNYELLRTATVPATVPATVQRPYSDRSHPRSKEGKEGKNVVGASATTGGSEAGGSTDGAPIPRELTDLPLYAGDPKLCRRLPELLSTWPSAYPSVNLMDEIRAAHAWEVANPAKQKKDRPKFLNGWLKRKHDDNREKESAQKSTLERSKTHEPPSF